MTVLLARAVSAIEVGDTEAASAAWDEAERLGGLAEVPIQDRLDGAGSAQAALSWCLWAAAGGNVSAMKTAARCYRDGVGTRRNRVQAVRWFMAMKAHGDGNGVHESIEVARRGMSDAQILEAGRLAGDEIGARSTIFALPPSQRGWRRRLLRR